MSIIIDLILVAIIALCAWKGWKSGIIVSVLGIIFIIVSVVVGNIVAKAYYTDFSGVMHPFVSGMVDSGVNTALGESLTDKEIVRAAEDDNTVYIYLNQGAENKKDADKNAAKGAKKIYVVTEDAKEDVWTVCYATMLNLGVAEDSAAKIADEVCLDSVKVNNEMSNRLGDVACDKLAFAVVFAMGFILAAIVFVVIGNIIDIKFTLPGAELVNDIGGAVLGAVRGILIVLFIGAVFRYLSIVLPDELISKTALLEYFIGHNAIAGAIGI